MQPVAFTRPPDSTQACPRCGAEIPVYRDGGTSCDHCGWNAQAPTAARSRQLLASVYVALGRRLSADLFAAVSAAPDVAPRPTRARLLAYLLAGLVYAVPLGLLASGLLLLAGAAGNCFLFIGGLLCLGFAWALAPRAPRLLPEDRAGLIARAQCPALYTLVDVVAPAVGSRPPDLIAVTGAFGATCDTVGWRRRRVLALGLPLFTILDGPERVALLGHALGQGVSGDPARGGFVGLALDALVRWHDLLQPEGFGDYHLAGLEGLGSQISNLVQLGLARLARAGAVALVQLLWRDQQRTAYQADALAARAAGTAPVLRLLEQLHLQVTFARVVSRVAQTGRDQDLFGLLRQEVSGMPAPERDRIGRLARLPESCLDPADPPTAYRLALLKAHPVPGAQVVPAPEEWTAVDRELAALAPRIQRAILATRNEGLE